jgi:hypothetical protein
MILLKADKDTEAGVLPDQQLLTDMGNYNEELVNAGVLLAGEGLHPSSKGVRVRFSGGKTTVIDGPFAETKELIAGFWLWQLNSREEAIEWLKRCPNPTGVEGEAEIRELGCASGLTGVSPTTVTAAPEGKKRFMVLLKADRSTEAGINPGEKLLAAMAKHNEQSVKAGVMLAGEGLQPSSKGARVKFSGSKRAVIDGPFTESKELVAGFWLRRRTKRSNGSSAIRTRVAAMPSSRSRSARCSRPRTSVRSSHPSSVSRRTACVRVPRNSSRPRCGPKEAR